MLGKDTIDARNPNWPSSVVNKSGVVYVATGRRFFEEAETAAAQLRLFNPNLPICIVSDISDYTPRFWDDLILVSNPYFGFRDKILMGLCPYERFLFLDTDTHVTADIGDIFELLKHFDFAGHQLFEGHDCPLPGIPDAFCEFNSGILGFRRAELNGFFAQWLKNYDEFYALNTAGNYHYSNSSDQKSLRKTVYFSNVRLAILGPEYNFVPHHVNFACAQVRIIHGRGRANLLDLDRRLNAKLGNRAYIPRLDVVIHNELPTGELIRLCGMSLLQLARVVGRKLTPLALRNRLRTSSSIRMLFLRNKFGVYTTKPDPKWHEPS
jgi:hypothetical protein